MVQGTHIIVDAEPPSGIYYLEAKDKRAIFVMPYEFNGRKRTMIGTTEKIFEGRLAYRAIEETSGLTFYPSIEWTFHIRPMNTCYFSLE